MTVKLVRDFQDRPTGSHTVLIRESRFVTARDLPGVVHTDLPMSVGWRRLRAGSPFARLGQSRVLRARDQHVGVAVHHSTQRVPYVGLGGDTAGGGNPRRHDI
jgi:hypothetical protein